MSAKHERGFRRGQVAALTGVREGTVDEWDREGVVCASVAGSRGNGNARLWSADDVLAVALVDEFRRHGLLPRASGEAVRFLRGTELGDIAPGTRLLILDGQAQLIPAGAELPEARIGFFLDLAALVGEVSRKLANVAGETLLELDRRPAGDALPRRAGEAGRALAALGGSAKPGDVGRRTGHTHGTQARAFGDLVEAGFIDRTHYRVTLTPAGWEAFGAAAGNHEREAARLAG